MAHSKQLKTRTWETRLRRRCAATSIKCLMTRLHISYLQGRSWGEMGYTWSWSQERHLDTGDTQESPCVSFNAQNYMHARAGLVPWSLLLFLCWSTILKLKVNSIPLSSPSTMPAVPQRCLKIHFKRRKLFLLSAFLSLTVLTPRFCVRAIYLHAGCSCAYNARKPLSPPPTKQLSISSRQWFIMIPQAN